MAFRCGTAETSLHACAQREALAGEIRSRIDTARIALDRIIEPLGYSDSEGRKIDEIQLQELTTRLNAMTVSIGRYGEWVRISAAAAWLESAELSELVTALDKNHLAPEDATDEFLYATAEVRWNAARESLPELNAISHLDRHGLVKEFCELEKQRLENTRSLLRALHSRQLPTGAYGEMGFLRGEMG